ncbi:heavy metal translocating P-type ATPase [Radiobacillus sp. PE A8.2]|uniref:heavy metal translocating P-type ATPase n=1 Tax=Radiobacillus sp. PE A8.2 TaxID=3380349 RepID=UPI0038902F46
MEIIKKNTHHSSPHHFRHLHNRAFLSKLKQHTELIAALLAGILILLAWSLEKSIPPSIYITLLIAAFVIGGYAKAKEGIEQSITNKELNVEMLMIFAAIGSASIGYWTEGAILVFIFSLSGALETYTQNKSERELHALMKLQPEEAIRISHGIKETVAVSQLEIGDHIFVKAGELMPVDGVVITGTTSVDESAISGEALPVGKQQADGVYAGTVNLNGSITIEVSKTASQSLVQKIIHLVQEAQTEKPQTQLFLDKFEKIYVKVVILAVLIMMFLPYLLFDWSLSQSIYRAMILLVVASPCALVASIMPAILSAISNGARNGVLFKGGVHLEHLANVRVIAFDKTGTLTKGKPIVTDAYFRNEEEAPILKAVANIEAASNHPLANAVLAYCQEKQIMPDHKVTNVKEISGKGVVATIDGEEWRIGNAQLVGEDAAYSFNNGSYQQLAEQAKSLVFIANSDGIAGLIALKDTIRDDAVKAIHAIKKLGIHTIMLTGDNKTTAAAIAAETGVDDYIATCIPEDKVAHIKSLRGRYHHVAMIGDGINDAPALANATVGIAMGAGTDVALETADIVLVKNKLEKIANAIRLSQRMSRVTKQNIIFSLTIISLLVISNFIQIIDLPLGVVGHEGSTILVILNGLRLLK